MFYLERPNDVPGTWYSEQYGDFVHGFENATPYASEQFASAILSDLGMSDDPDIRISYIEGRTADEIEAGNMLDRVADLARQMAWLHAKFDALMIASGIDIPPEPTRDDGTAPDDPGDDNQEG